MPHPRLSAQVALAAQAAVVAVAAVAVASAVASGEVNIHKVRGIQTGRV